MPAAPGLPSACSFCLLQEMCKQRSQCCGVLQHCLPSIPARPQSFPCPAWQHYTGTSAAGEGESFWSGHPPSPWFPSFIGLTIWPCSPGLRNTFPRESLKGLIIVSDSLLIVLISPFHSYVPVATGSPSECLVIPTNVGTWCSFKRESAAKLPPEIPPLLPLLRHTAQAWAGTKQGRHHVTPSPLLAPSAALLRSSIS